MDEEHIKLEVVTPEEAVLSEDVDEVVLPGTEGHMGVLPGHITMLTGLTIGEMIVRRGNEERSFFIDNGFAEILDDTVSVLTERCEGVSDIDIEHAHQEISVVEDEILRLEDAAEIAEDEAALLERYRDSLQRERTRLLVADESGDEVA